MSRVTYFILQAHTGTGVGHSQNRKNLEEDLEKMQVNGPGKAEISKEEISGSRRSMRGYTLTYFRLLQNLYALCSQQMGL